MKVQERSRSVDSSLRSRKQSDSFVPPLQVLIYNTGQQVRSLSGAFRDWQSRCRRKKWMNGRATPGKSYEPTDLEHFANTVSHGAMVIPSILAGELLLNAVSLRQRFHRDHNHTLVTDMHIPTPIHYEVSARTYGGCLVSLFLVSTMFHWITWLKCSHPTKKMSVSDHCCGSPLWEFFHMCDRIIIYAFIAGSYTPWLLLCSVHPYLAWLRWGIWVFVFIGTLYSCLFLEKYKLFETMIYVAQGVLPAIAIVTATSLPEHTPLHILSLGGFFYLSGVLLFKSDGWIPCAHAIWHMFVVAGAISHFCSCYYYMYYYPY